MAKGARRKRKLVQVVSNQPTVLAEKQVEADNIVDHYLTKFLHGSEVRINSFYYFMFLFQMDRIQLENVALILRHISAETMSKETLLRILELLCSNVDELLKDELKLQMFNAFLSRVEFGLPIPVEVKSFSKYLNVSIQFAIGVLLQHPSVVKKEISECVEAELNTCRELCDKLLRCRAEVFESRQEESKESETPPIVITLDEDDETITVDQEQPENLVDLF